MARQLIKSYTIEPTDTKAWHTLHVATDCNATLHRSQLQCVWGYGGQLQPVAVSRRYLTLADFPAMIHHVESCMSGSCKYKKPLKPVLHH